MTLLSIGDQVRPGAYRFHSRFNRAINFERNGRLVSVVDEQIGPGPLNIVIRGLKSKLRPPVTIINTPLQRRGTMGGGTFNRFSGFDVAWETAEAVQLPRSGMVTPLKRGVNESGPRRTGALHNMFEAVLSLKITTNTVFFAGHRFRFTSRRRYHSTLDFGPINPCRFHRNLAFLGELLRRTAPPNSLAFLLDERTAPPRSRNRSPAFERAFAAQARRAVRQVFHGHLHEGIRGLKGCGLGLTPSGDDFIAGLLLALNFVQKLHRKDLQPIAEAVFHAAHGANIFSNTFLALARRGLLFGRMKDLLLALTTGSEGSVRRATEKLFAIGATSGADLATGFFLTVARQSTRPSRSRNASAGIHAICQLKPGVKITH